MLSAVRLLSATRCFCPRTSHHSPADRRANPNYLSGDGDGDGMPGVAPLPSPLTPPSPPSPPYSRSSPTLSSLLLRRPASFRAFTSVPLRSRSRRAIADLQGCLRPARLELLHSLSIFPLKSHGTAISRGF